MVSSLFAGDTIEDLEAESVPNISPSVIVFPKKSQEKTKSLAIKEPIVLEMFNGVMQRKKPAAQNIVTQTDLNAKPLKPLETE